MVLALALWPLYPGAGSITRAEVVHHAGRYQLDLDVIIDAPHERVEALLTDDSRLPEISPSVVSARVISAAGPDQRRRHTVVMSCVFFFCFEFEAEEDVHVLGEGRIHTRIDPSRSDFRSGESTWLIEPAGAGRTRVTMTSAREPSFWIPPAVGPWLVERKLRRELREAVERIERLAGEEPARTR